MTCVVGMVCGKGRVWIGVDSAGTSPDTLDQRIRVDPKVFRNGDFLIGFTSSFRMGQVLMCDWQPPKRRKNKDSDTYRFMVSRVIPSLRSVLKNAGFSNISNNVERAGSFLVGYDGRLFEVDTDFQVAEYDERIAAVGSGAPFALGAMKVTGDSAPKPRLLRALEVASHFNAGVAGPFTVLST